MPREKNHPNEERIAGTLKALKRNEFLAFYHPTASEASAFVLNMVREGMTVGIGGSLTIRQMDLPGELEARGVRLLDHWREDLSAEDIFRIRKEQLTCDLFLTSVNALTEQGELVSRDGIGNRVSATTFGPAKVVIVASVQKIVPDLAAAFRRIEEIAAPMRAASLKLDLPCTRTHRCVHCHDPSNICRVTVVLHRRPMLTDLTVVLVGEPLGY